MSWQDRLGGPLHQVSQGRSGLYLNKSTHNHSGGHLQTSAGSQSQATPPPHRQVPSRLPHHQVRHRAPAVHQTSYSYYNNNCDNSNNSSNNHNIPHHGVRSPTTSVYPRSSSYPHLANNIGTSDTGRSSLYHAIGVDNYDQDYPPLPPPIHLPTTRGRCYNCGEANHIRKNCRWDHKVRCSN